MLNLISSVLQQECKQELVNLDKGRITGSAPSPEKIAPFPEWRMVSRIFISGPWQVWVRGSQPKRNSNQRVMFKAVSDDFLCFERR